jgi:hypothetical protein
MNERPKISAAHSFFKLLAGIDNVPNTLCAVVGYKKRAVLSNCNSDRPAPDLTVRCDESGEEIFILSGSMAVVHRDADDFVAGAVGAVPGAVLSREAVAIVGRGKLLALVKSHLQRCKVRLQDDVRCDDLGLQLRVCTHQARVLVTAHVPPWPAVESIFLHAGDVVGNEVVAEPVTLVGGAPELTGCWIDGFADAVANAAGVDLEELALGGELKNIGAVKFVGMGVRVVRIRG